MSKNELWISQFEESCRNRGIQDLNTQKFLGIGLSKSEFQRNKIEISRLNESCRNRGIQDLNTFRFCRELGYPKPNFKIGIMDFPIRRKLPESGNPRLEHLQVLSGAGLSKNKCQKTNYGFPNSKKVAGIGESKT